MSNAISPDVLKQIEAIVAKDKSSGKHFDNATHKALNAILGCDADDSVSKDSDANIANSVQVVTVSVHNDNKNEFKQVTTETAGKALRCLDSLGKRCSLKQNDIGQVLTQQERPLIPRTTALRGVSRTMLLTEARLLLLELVILTPAQL